MEHIREHIRRMVVAQNRIDGIYYLMAKKLGTTENTLTLLYALYNDGACTQKQISEEWLIPKTTLNTIVKECVAAGYIQLEPHFRTKTLRLTEQGRAYARSLLEPLHAAEEAAMERVLESASAEFITALERFAGEFQREYDQFIVQGENHSV